MALHCQVPSLWSTTQPSEPSTLPGQAGPSSEVWVPWACRLRWLPTLSWEPSLVRPPPNSPRRQPEGPSDSQTSRLLRPEWWRAAEAHGRGAATFLPSFIGFPPFFSPHIQPNHSASPIQVRTPGKNSHNPAKGTAQSHFYIKSVPTSTCVP